MPCCVRAQAIRSPWGHAILDDTFQGQYCDALLQCLTKSELQLLRSNVKKNKGKKFLLGTLCSGTDLIGDTLQAGAAKVCQDIVTVGEEEGQGWEGSAWSGASKAGEVHARYFRHGTRDCLNLFSLSFFTGVPHFRLQSAAGGLQVSGQVLRHPRDGVLPQVFHGERHQEAELHQAQRPPGTSFRRFFTIGGDFGARCLLRPEVCPHPSSLSANSWMGLHRHEHAQPQEEELQGQDLGNGPQQGGHLLFGERGRCTGTCSTGVGGQIALRGTGSEVHFARQCIIKVQVLSLGRCPSVHVARAPEASPPILALRRNHRA